MSIDLVAGVFQEIIREFEERVWLWSETENKVNKIMWQEKTRLKSRIEMYETALMEGIKKMDTVEWLEKLVKNYERVCRKKLPKKHPLYQEYKEKKDEIEKSSSQNTSENPRDSERLSESSKSFSQT